MYRREIYYYYKIKKSQSLKDNFYISYYLFLIIFQLVGYVGLSVSKYWKLNSDFCDSGNESGGIGARKPLYVATEIMSL